MSEFTPITTQEELDAVIGERLKRERDTVTKRYEEKYAGYVSGADHEAALADMQKQVDDAAKKQSENQALIDGLNAKVRGYETNSVKMRVAQELGLPHELAERLSGDDEDAIRKNPMRKIKSLRIDKLRARHPLTAEQLELIRDGCRGYKEKALVEFLVSSGCRVSEVAGLRVQDIDWQERKCKVIGKGNK